MSQRGLEALLRPKSIAVIGASMKPNRAGYLMMRNLLAGGFNGPVLPVTPAWKAVLGVLAWPNINSLPFSPISPCCAPMPAVTWHYSKRLARKAVKPALFSQLPRRSTRSCWPAHHATTYVFWVPTAWDFSHPGKDLTPAFPRPD
jgi:hypothetical protein